MSDQPLTPEEELKEIGVDSICGIMTLLDVMAGEPPDGYDFDKEREAAHKRADRAGELLHMILTKEQILGISDIQRELVEVPEWGGSVYVKGLTGAERDKFESSMVTVRGKNRDVNLANIRAKLVSLATCDEDGKRLFTDTDVQVLSQKSASALQRIFEVAQRLSGLAPADIAELTEEIKADPFDGSAST